MNFFLSPIYALFNVRFYRSLLSVSMFRGFLYLIYLSLITAIVSSVMLNAAIMPKVDVEAEWFINQIPELTFTAGGLSATIKQPYSINARNGELVAIINTNLDAIKEGQMGGAAIFLTKKKAYVKSGEGKLEVYDLIGQTKDAMKEGQSFILNADRVSTFYQGLKRWAPIFFLVAIFIGVLIWKIIAAFFYSLIALILNLFRKARLGYSALFNVAAAAMTPIWLLQILTWILPPLRFSYVFWVSLLITGVYLAVFIFATYSLVAVTGSGEQS